MWERQKGTINSAKQEQKNSQDWVRGTEAAVAYEEEEKERKKVFTSFAASFGILFQYNYV